MMNTLVQRMEKVPFYIAGVIYLACLIGAGYGFYEIGMWLGDNY
ncbi:hypothetical protein [Bacillus fonticola]|nr:hypothetical protein [Bacillus fonticola]